MTEADFKSGYVSIIGRPNVGKSTLLNFLVGSKIAITTDKPQTTRTRIVGIKTQANAQIVFLDTPGIHKPPKLMNKMMVKTALHAMSDMDAIVFITEVKKKTHPEDLFILRSLGRVTSPVLLAINKCDLLPSLPDVDIVELTGRYRSLLEFHSAFHISALNGTNVDGLLEALVAIMPEGPMYYPEETVTESPEEFVLAEIIREKATMLTHQELPYSTGVVVESVEEVGEADKAHLRVNATIYVERSSQRVIVIGKNGQMLKKIGTLAREEMEPMLGSRVFLQLWVKVKEKWTEDRTMLKRMGL